MRTNTKVTNQKYTHEGAKASPQTALQELTRAVSTCLLFENTFYEKGSEITQRIEDLCKQVSFEDISKLAIRARNDLKLRHVPLFLALQLLRNHAGSVAGDTIAAIVQRPDEAGELLSLYQKPHGSTSKSKRENGKGVPLANQLKRGLRLAFPKWDAYQLAKWDKDTASIKVRDAMFLVHPTPKGNAPIQEARPTKHRGAVVRHTTGQGLTWTKLATKELESPDTWEVSLSAGADKRDTFTRLLTPDERGRRKLPYMALLMNLRNMVDSNVNHQLISQALLEGAPTSKALPFRFISAVKHAPALAQPLSDAMERVISGELLGDTVLLIDVSGSMAAPISAKSTLQRWEAAGALAILLRQVCKNVRVFTFSNELVEVPNYRGMALLAGIQKSQAFGGTELR